MKKKERKKEINLNRIKSKMKITTLKRNVESLFRK